MSDFPKLDVHREGKSVPWANLTPKEAYQAGLSEMRPGDADDLRKRALFALEVWKYVADTPVCDHTDAMMSASAAVILGYLSPKGS